MPRLSFSPALPVGVASDSEFVDIELSEPFDPDLVAMRLDAELPEGLRVLGARAVARGAPSMDTSIGGFRYAVELPQGWGDAAWLAERVAAFSQASSFPVPRRAKGGATKMIDARKTTTVRVRGRGLLELEVQRTPQATLKPALIVATLLGLDDEGSRQMKVTKLETIFRDEPEIFLNGPSAAAM